jgi:hypothetical protein
MQTCYTCMFLPLKCAESLFDNNHSSPKLAMDTTLQDSNGPGLFGGWTLGEGAGGVATPPHIFRVTKKF